MDERTVDYTWFFRAEFPGVVRTAWLILHDRQRAEDIAQEAFAQLFVHWARVSRYEQPDAWVRRVAIRRAVKLLGRERRRADLERVDALEAWPVDRPSAVDPDLVAAIRSLSPRQRAAVALFYLEDRPAAQVADILGCSASAAKVHLHGARKRLAEILGEEWVSDVV